MITMLGLPATWNRLGSLSPGSQMIGKPQPCFVANAWRRLRVSSRSTATKCTRPLYSAASRPNPVASCLQGAHQVEKKSITAGLPASEALEMLAPVSVVPEKSWRRAAQLHGLELLGEHGRVEAGRVMGATPGDHHADDDHSQQSPRDEDAAAHAQMVRRRAGRYVSGGTDSNRRAIAAISSAVASRSASSTISFGECM